jgi:hypothetical protein
MTHAADHRHLDRSFAVRVLTADRLAHRDVTLPLDADGSPFRLRLTSLIGSRVTQVPVLHGGEIQFRVEIPCESEEQFALDLSWDADCGLLVDAPGRHALRLPADPYYAPPRPLRPHRGPALDLCFLIDGTARNKDLGPLFVPSPDLDAFIAPLFELVERLRGPFHDLRLCVMAYGDHPVEDAVAEDLKPAYLLWPDASARQLQAMSQSQLDAAFREIPATSGGDFVDALGDGLHACADLRWRFDARRMVVVAGDSPGFSIFEPSHPWADAHVRQYDVDSAAAALHRKGVEIMTIYHRPPNPKKYDIDDPSPFLRFARKQFSRLASYAALHVEFWEFDGARVAGVLNAPPSAIGHGVALGLAVDL